MYLLRYLYLYSYVNNLKFKLIRFPTAYKKLCSFSGIFYLKCKPAKSYNYRIHLLNASFHFLFIDYIYVVNYFEYLNKSSLVSFTLPTIKKRFSILRAPFVYSKSRESLSINSHFLFFDVYLQNLSELHFFFNNGLLYSMRFSGTKFWYKRRIHLL